MAKKPVSLEDIAKFDLEPDPRLASIALNLLTAPYEEFMGIICRYERRKSAGGRFENKEGKLPEGQYIELKVDYSDDPRRVVIGKGDESRYSIFVTPDHYNTFYYAGQASF